MLTEGWSLAVAEAGGIKDPSGLSTLTDWVRARVPGTAAEALALAGRYDPENPTPLHDKDIWYVTEFAADEPGRRILRFDGLATIAEVYLNDEKILESRNMFLGHEVPVELRPENRLVLCFRALQPVLDEKGPRARWRPQLATSQGLRLVRTTLLGHMPGWCPDVHAVGPYRPISLAGTSTPRVTAREIGATVDRSGNGVLAVSADLEGNSGAPVLGCCGTRTHMVRGGDGRWSATLTIPGVEPWMPHTHGKPALHDVRILCGDTDLDLGRTGFRTIDVDRGADGKGFGLVVNGVPVFCRGAVWTNADILRLPGDRDNYRSWLELARDAGMNMLRIGGTMTYETRAFFELCDELGILVWQDFQFANHDYPVKDEAFVETVEAEARYQLDVCQGCPSLAVLCGGSEIYQQGAMMGLPESRWKGPLSEEILAAISRDRRPDVAYVANSPCDGALPFSPNEGIAHYYGVGAYQRPLEDARRADVRFAAECLAFSNVPQGETLAEHLSAKPVHDPRWKARVPRDRGVGWDFEDVRDHYFKELYGLDPATVRYGDPDRYLDLSRAVTGEVMAATFAEWRRKRSSCRGALVWTFQDLLPGAGWGIVDATGIPKPAYYALKRTFQPIQVTLTDEGTNGLGVHVLNETPETKPLVLTLACLRDGSVPVVSGRRELDLAPREAQEIAATDLFGAFFDVTYAYRFGPPAHDVTVARLIDPATDEVLSEAFHFPQGYPQARLPLEIEGELEQAGEGTWTLRLEARRFAQSVHLDIPGFQVADDWFHLAPGAGKKLMLVRKAGTDPDLLPVVQLAALNGLAPKTYSAA
ncbi:glycoside hydrolase family 2 protein [Roseibium aggregatum]|uniref:Glycoside hydrolase family 2 protein n=1 Tax=Roseibium aggregatum TaxID=187304 RepID=A0A926NZ02_9HYPH|nr:glycoside hydrolase family 2 protein [Roseibium aggregatum]MBD1548959.1 glycoside hydrolase family 2 protein [Roseibium aggregatum]